MRRAHTLPVSTDLTVSQIADHVGYANPYHLIRAFKKQFVLQPGRYRSENRPDH